jgi:hypothetical protein
VLPYPLSFYKDFYKGVKMHIVSFYEKLFHTEEIYKNKRLQVILSVILGLSLFDLSYISFVPKSRYGSLSCWSFFQKCHEIVPIPELPHSYFYTGLMAFLLGIHLFVAISCFKKKWLQAHFFLLMIMCYKFLFHFVLRDTGYQNFEFFMQIPAFVFLFSKDKILSLRWVWSSLYFFAASVKFHESWIAGTYFTSMNLGLPLVPLSLTVLVSQSVILFEIFFSFGLVSKNFFYRQISFWLWVLFHLYSVFLVGYFYPIRGLVYLFCFFYPLNKREDFKPKGFNKRPALVTLFLVLFSLHFLPLMKTQDTKFTFEGLGSSFFMFDSNHQCFIKTRYYDKDQNVLHSEKYYFLDSRSRCSPWHALQRIQFLCEKLKAHSAYYTHDHSINGNPIYRMVDEKQACQLEYNFFGGNSWIKDLKNENISIVGYPYRNQIVGTSFSKENPYSLTPVIERSSYQKKIIENLDQWKAGFLFLWLSVIFFGIRRIFWSQE